MKYTIIPVLFVLVISCQKEHVSSPQTPGVSEVKLDAGPQIQTSLPLRKSLIPDIKITNPSRLSLTTSWRQLSGTVVNVDDITRFRIYDPGNYSFEISLKFADQVVAKDTLYINAAYDSECQLPERTNLTKNLVGRFTFWNRVYPAQIIDNKIFFTSYASVGSSTYDPGWDITFLIFDLKGSPLNGYNGLVEPKTKLANASIGNMIYFAGGTESTSTVEIYNAKTDKWTYSRLSAARSSIGIAAAGSKVFFAGGTNAQGQDVSTIDIFDTLTKTWSIANLTEGRRDISAIAIKDKLYFVGGATGTTPSKSVDIYDLTTGQMSSFSLMIARIKPVVSSFENHLFVGGGIVADSNYEYRAEIIELNRTYSFITCLSEYSYGTVSPISVWHNNKLFILNTQSNRGAIDIYDPANNSWQVNAENFQTKTENVALFKADNMVYLVQVRQLKYDEYEFLVFTIH